MNPKGCYGVCRVISDPDPAGGFPSGAKLSGVVPMLAQGTFTPGSEIAFQGHRWRVCGVEGERQWLVHAEERR